MAVNGCYRGVARRPLASHADVLRGSSRGQERMTNPQERLRGRLGVPALSLGSLSNNECDGYENVT